MIAEVLKSFRKSNGYSVEDVRRLLKERYIQVAAKTIYGWESGQSQPNIDTLFILCELYDIRNLLTTFGYSNDKEFHFSRLEEELILSYRKHPEVHHAVHKLLGVTEH